MAPLAVGAATPAAAQEPDCAERIRRAIEAPQDVSDCRLLAEDGGRVLVLAVRDRVYLVMRTEPENTRLELDLRSRAVKHWSGEPTVRDHARFSSPRNLPDAKFFYFPFETAARRFNRAAGQGKVRWVCLDPRRLSLAAASLESARC